jgi:uncharacterized SAM-binding protein YcdF (DUF218 family)
MFFILSKLLLIFILPLTWVFAFLIAGFVTRNKKLKRNFIITSAILLFVFSSPFFLNRFANAWDIAPGTLNKPGPYSCAIVLGGFSSAGANGIGYFNGSCDRFLEALKLWTTGRVSHIFITGGNGNLIPGNFEEGDWVKTQLQLLKVPDSCIVIENRSRNTIENAAFSKPILIKNHLAPPYILVTSAFHMRRSLGIFKNTGIDVVPYPCAYIAGNSDFSFSDLIPDATILGTWNIYTKELVGTLVNHLR